MKYYLMWEFQDKETNKNYGTLEASFQVDENNITGERADEIARSHIRHAVLAKNQGLHSKMKIVPMEFYRITDEGARVSLLPL